MIMSTDKAVANGPVGQVLAGPINVSQGKNKIPFYNMQVKKKVLW